MLIAKNVTCVNFETLEIVDIREQEVLLHKFPRLLVNDGELSDDEISENVNQPSPENFTLRDWKYLQ